MAREKKEVPQLGGNLSAIKDEIKSQVDLILAAENKRSEANADIAAARAKIESLGIAKKALAWAMAYSKLDVDQRSGIDLSFTIVREAIGLPVQADLFDGTMIKLAEAAPTEKPKPVEDDLTGAVVKAFDGMGKTDLKAPPSLKAN